MNYLNTTILSILKLTKRMKYNIKMNLILNTPDGKFQ